MRSSCPVWMLVFLAVFSINGLANIGQGIAAYEQKNYEEAHRILKPLADANQPEALHRMGNMYYRGFGVAKDQAKGVAYWRKAAELGYVDSVYNLGIAHKFGSGVPKDVPQALKWFERAAEMGSDSAMFQIGKLYRDGQLGITDLNRARIYFEKAASKGNRMAMNDLAVMYEKGNGAPRDLARAWAWFKLSAEKGHEKASTNLGITEAKMTSAQLAEGRELFARYSASQPQPTQEPPRLVKKEPPPAPPPEPEPAKPQAPSKPHVVSGKGCFPNLDKALGYGLDICEQTLSKPEQRQWCKDGVRKGEVFFKEFKKDFVPDSSDPRSLCLQTIRNYRWALSDIEQGWKNDGMAELEAHYKDYGMKVYSQAVQKLDNVNQ